MVVAAPPTPPADARSPQCLTTNLGWLLSQASYGYGAEVTAALEPLGLGSRGHCVLMTALGGTYTQKQLADAIGIDKTMMMVTLDELERLGLAARRRSGTDPRAHVVSVTAAGERKVAEAQRIIESVQEAVLGSLPAKQREALVEGLRHLVAERLADPPQSQPGTRRRGPRA